MKIGRFIISDIERLETNKYLVYDIFLKKNSLILTKIWLVY